MTLTMSLLGNYGRLGNQLWQIASTVGVATDMNEQARFPLWDYVDYFKVPDYMFTQDLEGAREAWETPLLDHIAPRHRIYMQDRALWSEYGDTILYWFQPSDRALELLEDHNPEFFSVPKEDRIAVHIRRGDAIPVSPHLYPLQSPLYVRGALELLGDGHVFMFSDDPEWCEKTFDWFDYTLITGNFDWVDLHLMGQCGKHAIGNSSFSYWGATISRDPAVCYPETWYGPDFFDLDYRLMIPEGWVAIPDPDAGARYL